LVDAEIGVTLRVAATLEGRRVYVAEVPEIRSYHVVSWKPAEPDLRENG
jgi:hypothetical protein